MPRKLEDVDFFVEMKGFRGIPEPEGRESALMDGEFAAYFEVVVMKFMVRFDDARKVMQPDVLF